MKLSLRFGLSGALLLVGVAALRLSAQVRPLFLGIPEPSAPSGPVQVLRNFAGVTAKDSLAPDPAIAAGPDRLVLITNAEVVIMGKTGNAITRKGLHAFFLPTVAPGEGSAGDVAALYDFYSNRFFLAQAAKVHPQSCGPGTCVGHNLLAVSKTSSPGSLETTDWYFYAFDRYQERTASGVMFTTNWGDFDHLGATEQALFISSRRYREADDAQVGPKIRILDKSKLIAGETPTTWTDILDDRNFAGIQPATMFGLAPAFFLVSRIGCGFMIWGITDPLGTPNIVTRSVSLSGDCTSQTDPPQPSGALLLSVTGAGLATTPVFRNGSLWMADMWRQGTGTSAVAAVKWAEVDVSRWPDAVNVVQQGFVDAGGAHTFFPALTVDFRGNMTLAFNTSSTDEYPSVKVSARASGDPLGSLRALAVVKAGSAPSLHVDGAGRNRFGDYLYVALDPATSTTWVHGQIGVSGDWQTWVGEARVDATGINATSPRLSFIPVRDGITFTWSAVPGTASYDLEIGSASGSVDFGVMHTTALGFTTTVKPGTYYVRVRSKGAFGSPTAVSNEAVVTVAR